MAENGLKHTDNFMNHHEFMVPVRYFTTGSRFIEAYATAHKDGIQINSEDGSFSKTIAPHHCRLDPLVKNMTARLYLSDGCLIEADNADDLAVLYAYANGKDIDKFKAKNKGRFHGLKPIHWALLSLGTILMPLMLWFGYPMVSDIVGRLLPYHILNKPSQAIMVELENHLLSPTELPQDTQQRYREDFAKFVNYMGIDNLQIRLLFRSSDFIGPNAFALPNGTIVLLDELVALSHDDEEILAVLAHELGHVYHKHGIRNYVRATGITFLTYFFIADSSGFFDEIASMALGLVQLSYSREFELEADEYSAEMMRHFAMNPSSLINILRRLGVGEESHLYNSHPGLKDRLESTILDKK